MADYSNITTMMDVLVRRTEGIVNEAYRCHKEESLREMSKMTSLVFPQYSADDDESQDKQKKQKEKTRISEQELRFAFVQAFHEYKCTHNCNYQYGVEVPTKDKYLFTEKDEENKRKYKPRIEYHILSTEISKIETIFFISMPRMSCINKMSFIERYLSTKSIK